jgi:pyruvate dehydrogenase E1 component
MNVQAPHDIDPTETQEWIDALAAVIEVEGENRGQFLLRKLEEAARSRGVFTSSQPFSAYRNTVPADM